MRTEKFDLAIPLILEHEGGYVNDPVDPGGETKYGISKRSYPDVDIKNLTVEQAKDIYFEDWWEKFRYEEIEDVLIGTKIFDTSIHMGPVKAHKIAQRALDEAGIDVGGFDGKIGQRTLDGLNVVDPEQFLDLFRGMQEDYYRKRVQQNPKLRKYLRGWLRRAQS